MQNKYVGDVGDFGKYGLLRFLSGMTDSEGSAQLLRLAVHWYLHEDEKNKSDGKFISYLTGRPRYRDALRSCDEELHDKLYELVAAHNRSVAAVREGGVLPEDTAYFEQILNFPRYSSRASRSQVREAWLDAALMTAREAELVFVDPDNSISCKKDPLRKEGLKHVFIDDIRRFVDNGKSVVIYHHLGRQGTHRQQILCWSETLRKEFGLPVRALRYRRGNSRAFFVIMQQPHRELLDCRLDSFPCSSWVSGGHFEIVA